MTTADVGTRVTSAPGQVVRRAQGRIRHVRTRTRSVDMSPSRPACRPTTRRVPDCAGEHPRPARDRPQRRPRRGLRRLAAGRRRRAAGHRDERERRLRLPRRRPLDHAPGVRAGRASAGVAVGAQVSYRDLAGFGRRFMDVEPAELTDDVLYQLGALDGIARVSGTRVSYVKPHGALYNAAVDRRGAGRGRGRRGRRATTAAAACSGCPARRCCGAAEAAGLRAVARGLRRPRRTRPTARSCRAREPGALVHDAAAVAERAVRHGGRRRGRGRGRDAPALEVDSVCVHGDTPGAVELARAVRTALEAAGLPLASFTA